MNADPRGSRQTVAACVLGSFLCGAFMLLHSSTGIASASDAAELMNSFEHLCLRVSMDFKAISGVAAVEHLPIVDKKVTTVGGVGRLQTTTWLLRKEPPAALIAAGKTAGGQVTMCGVSDHTTPLADMANELAARIRTQDIQTRGGGVNDVSLEDNGGTVHIVSDPGGTSTSGFFLFRLAP